MPLAPASARRTPIRPSGPAVRLVADIHDHPVWISGAAAAMLVGPNGPLGGFWRPGTLAPKPQGWQLAGLLGSGFVEAVGFGLALAILALAKPAVAALIPQPGRARAAQLTSAWLVGSWWPHTALHMHFGTTTSALVTIEPVFHAGSILAAAVLLWALAGARTREHQEIH